MTIENNNLFSSSYDALKSFINTNVSDPRKRFKKQWIHPSEPNISDQAFDGYPYIILNVAVEEEDKSMDRNISNKVFRAVITVVSNEATEVDSISDEIVSKIKDETLTNNLNEFKSIELASSDFNFRVVGGRKINFRNIGLIGRKRI